MSDECQLNDRDNFGYAPLHYAAKFNRHAIVVMLVEAGASKHCMGIMSYRFNSTATDLSLTCMQLFVGGCRAIS